MLSGSVCEREKVDFGAPVGRRLGRTPRPPLASAMEGRGTWESWGCLAVRALALILLLYHLSGLVHQRAPKKPELG